MGPRACLNDLERRKILSLLGLELAFWSDGQLVGRWVGWLLGCQGVGWLVGRMVSWSVGGFVGWSVGR